VKKALPSPIAAEGIHEEVISLLIAEKRGKVLDVPAGQGALTLKLKEMGFEVYAADISPESFVVEDIECKRVDLNKSLPYADGAFDYIVCVEGIEHLENPFLTLREFSRILEPEGKIILTTPNILNLRARLSYLFFGYPGVCFKPIYQQIKEGTATFNLHISPLSFLP
jgi:2-polyprenyl-3-methyl-5-hydroxy-6-metoxy-1,4-benzoquinol methylase